LHWPGERGNAVPQQCLLERWFAWPQVLFTAQVLLFAGICSWLLLVSLVRRWKD